MRHEEKEDLRLDDDEIDFTSFALAPPVASAAPGPAGPGVEQDIELDDETIVQASNSTDNVEPVKLYRIPGL